MILVDTSVWIDLTRKRQGPSGRWLVTTNARNEVFCTCGVVVTEILQGIRSQRDYQEVTRELRSLAYLPTTRAAYELAADIYRAARARGKTIRNTTDCIIAACAITNNVPLAQKDKDFVTIADLSDLELEKL